MSHNLKVQSESRIRHSLYMLGQSFSRRISRGITRDAIVMLGVLTAVSLVSVLVFIETLFP